MTSLRDGPEGGCHGWQAAKNRQEQLLAPLRDGLKGGCHEWQATKNRRE
ncbi:hypothetical protein [Cellvibrio japonicus]|uniref:Uncharacterized protein n=1 Tax=Cellvibrio japonicus (strain Ueda107) TaxID=498211 RepID=B3PDV1_CELJU|nr:hypothetical protein [Cellvibrio japonicus]ACE82671.1 hypothetical protein CJA_3154 [Cellvibrio japonicus Ueda107]